MNIEKFYEAYNIRPESSQAGMIYPVLNDGIYFKLIDVILQEQTSFTLRYGVYSTRQQVLNELTRNSKIYYNKVRNVLGVKEC